LGRAFFFGLLAALALTIFRFAGLVLVADFFFADFFANFLADFFTRFSRAFFTTRHPR
jgi:hypothetical protein